MSDTIVVMKDGLVQQIGTPTDVYNEPKNAFVADFIGESNILPGLMLRDELVRFDGRDFACVDKGFGENKAVDVVVRPEDVKLSAPESGMLRGVVRTVVFKGVHYEMTVETQGFTWLVHSTLSEPVGAAVGLNIVPFDIHIMQKGD